MSRSAQIVLGGVFVGAALIFALCGVTAPRQAPHGSAPFYVTAAFCVVVAIACFLARGRGVTLRVTGCGVFAVCVWYLIVAPSTKSVLAMTTFGLPAAYTAITARYPLWGEWAAAFTPGDEPHE
jgi:hypothetical protein